MESPFGLTTAHWDHEPVWVVPSVWCPAFRRPGPAKAGTPNRTFMESPLSFFRMHWDHEPLTAWSPGLSRSKPFEPPKGGTPNQPWFRESPLSLFRMHWDLEPTRRAGFPACQLTGHSRPVLALRATGKSPEPADRNVCPTNPRFMESQHDFDAV